MKDNPQPPASRLSFLEHPPTPPKVEERFTFYTYLTFRNLVISVGVVTFVLFLAHASSLEVTLLSVAVLALLGFVGFELYQRRQWEEIISTRMDSMGTEYERLVREVARNRNDNDVMRSRIADAADDFIKSYDRSLGKADVERRILKTLATRLASLGEAPAKENEAEEELVLDPAIAEKKASIKGITDVEVGKRLRDDQVVQLLNAALKKDRVDLFLQPIVNLPQRKVRFYETLARIRVMSDIYLPATRYLELAMQHNMIATIDNMLLIRGMQEVRRAAEGDYTQAFFFNINSTTLNDSKFMGDLVEFISQNRTLAPQLIFELGQRDLSTMSPDIYPALDGLARLGCRFSMDRVDNLAFDFRYLELRHIRFIKISAAVLLARLKKDGGSTKLKQIKEKMDGNGIDLIVDKVEKERNLIDLLELDIDNGQGYLFGKPDLADKFRGIK